MNVATRKVKQLRLPTSIERRFKLVNYGLDNLYPQTVEQIAFRSPMTESALEALDAFTYGEGFELNGDMIINRYEQTLNDILSEISKDYSPFNGWGLHFNVNQLGLITEILPFKFKDLRFGLPDDAGRHYDMKHCIKWDAAYYNQMILEKDIQTYPLWNKRELRPPEFDNIEDFQGFAHYWTPELDSYPKASFDSVLDSAQTNGEIQVFELGSIQNSFLGTSIFKYPGKFASKTEKTKFVAELGELTGSENAGSVLVTEVPQNFEGELIENLPANNNDTLFAQTTENVDNRIVSRFGIPFPLLGIQPSGGIFNQEQLKDSYIYYNSRTIKRRNKLVSEFNKFMKFWVGGAVEVGSILERQFIIEGQEQTNE